MIKILFIQERVLKFGKNTGFKLRQRERQEIKCLVLFIATGGIPLRVFSKIVRYLHTVSYTHLTLPTIYSV